MKLWGLTEEQGGMHISCELKHSQGCYGKERVALVPGGYLPSWGGGHGLELLGMDHLLTTTGCHKLCRKGGVQILSPSDFCLRFLNLRGEGKKWGGSHIFSTGIFRAPMELIMELFQRITFCYKINNPPKLRFE